MKKNFVLFTAALVAAAALTGCKRAPKNVTPLTNRAAAGEFTPPATATPEPAPAFTPSTQPSTAPTTTPAPQPRNNTPSVVPGGKALGSDDGSGSRNLTPAGQQIDTSKPIEQGHRPENVTEDPTVLQAQTVYFDYDKAALKKSESSKVEAVAAFLKNEPTASLRVEGNCDERGTEEYNRALGERRALAVREYLVGLGIAPERVTTISYGEDKPADTGHDEAAWTKNRRGDFVVLRPNASAK